MPSNDVSAHRAKTIRLIRVLAAAGRHVAQLISDMGILNGIIRFATREYIQSQLIAERAFEAQQETLLLWQTLLMFGLQRELIEAVHAAVLQHVAAVEQLSLHSATAEACQPLSFIQHISMTQVEASTAVLNVLSAQVLCATISGAASPSWTIACSLQPRLTAVAATWLTILSTTAASPAITVLAAAVTGFLASFHETQARLAVAGGVVAQLESVESTFDHVVQPFLMTGAVPALLKQISRSPFAESLPELRFANHPSILQGTHDFGEKHVAHRSAVALLTAVVQLAQALLQRHRGLVAKAAALVSSADLVAYFNTYTRQLKSPRTRNDMAIYRRLHDHMLQFRLIQLLHDIDVASLKHQTFLSYGIAILAYVPAGFEHVARDMLLMLTAAGEMALPAAVAASFIKLLNSGPLAPGFILSSTHRWVANPSLISSVALPQREDEQRFDSSPLRCRSCASACRSAQIGCMRRWCSSALKPSVPSGAR